MSILDMASGQNLIGGQDASLVGGNPAAPSTGWPGSLSGTNQSSYSGSLLYGPTPDNSVPVDNGIPAEVPQAEPQMEAPPQAAPPQAMPPQAPSNEMEALAWHNQGLLRHVQQLESRVAQIKPLEDLLRYDPTAYERMIQALYQPLNQPPAAQQQVQAPPPAEAAPQFPWEQNQQPPAAAPPQPTFDPRQLAQVNALLLTEAVSPIKQELEQTKVELAKIHLERQIGDLSRRYGNAFNPKEVVAYAYSNGIADLERAFKGVLGERSYQQFHTQPQAAPQPMIPGPAQVGGYATAQIPPPAAVPAVPDARVEPTRARAGAPQSSVFPQNYKPRDPHDAANYALHLLREMKQRP